MAATDLNFPGFDDFRRYQRGEMSFDEQHRFEKRMLDDPFVAEAYEGFLASNLDDISQIRVQEELSNHLKARLAKKENRSLPLWAYASAASVLLCLGVYWLVFVDNKEVESNKVASEAMMKESPQAAANEKPAAHVVPEPQQPLAVKPSKPAGNEEVVSGPPVAETEQQHELKPELLADSAKPRIAVAGEAVAPVPSVFPAAPSSVQAFSKQTVRPKTENTGMHLVSGRVVDRSGQGLAGVSIFVSPQKGALADSAGNFSIPVQDEDSLQLAYVGFKGKKIPINKQDLGNIRLDEDANTLSEVVVTHTQVARKKQSFAPASATPPVLRAEPADGWPVYQSYLDKNTFSNQKGKVTVSFVVSHDGTLSGFSARGDSNLHAEAIRIIRQGPAWKAAQSNGVAITTVAEIQLQFRKSK